MTIADVLAILATLVVAALGFPSLAALVRLALPDVADRARGRLASSPIQSLAVGLVVAVVVVVVASTLGNALAGPGKLLGFLLLCCGLAVGAVGSTGLVLVLANAARGGAEASVRDVLSAAAILELACVLPFVGWFVVFPATFLASIGAGALAIARRPASPVVAATDVPLDLHA